MDETTAAHEIFMSFPRSCYCGMVMCNFKLRPRWPGDALQEYTGRDWIRCRWDDGIIADEDLAWAILLIIIVNIILLLIIVIIIWLWMWIFASQSYFWTQHWCQTGSRNSESFSDATRLFHPTWKWGSCLQEHSVFPWKIGGKFQSWNIRLFFMNKSGSISPAASWPWERDHA